MFVSDCDEAPDTGAPAPPKRAAVPAGDGVVRGVVKFSAARPAAKVIGGDCCPGAAPAVDESTVVNTDGTLKHVVVYVKDGPNVASPGDSVPALLDQKDCRYLPHVLAVRTNQPVDVSSHDPTLHNVHVRASVNRAMNFSQTVNATRRLTFTAEEFIGIKCDVHPWMSAHVAVFDHPFFAVTGDDGTFQIERLPRGTYTLIAWHEKYGTSEKQINLTGGEPVDVRFEYRANAE